MDGWDFWHLMQEGLCGSHVKVPPIEGDVLLNRWEAWKMACLAPWSIQDNGSVEP
jgi:hypothetical protein